MSFKYIFAILTMMIVISLSACTQQVPVNTTNTTAPATEMPSANGAAVQENVIAPAKEPEQITDEMRAVLTEHKDSEHLIRGRPGVGQTIEGSPRKIELVFNYPLTKGTTISLWDMAGSRPYELKDTLVAETDTDALVAIAYLNGEELQPGIYKVTYNAVFPGKGTTTTSTGYYYFEVK